MIIRESHLVPEGIRDVRLSRYARTAFPSIPSRKGADKAIKLDENQVAIRNNGALVLEYLEPITDSQRLALVEYLKTL